MSKNQKFDLILKCQKALISDPQNPQEMTMRKCDIGISQGKIIAIEDQIDSDAEVWDAGDHIVMPGLIDSQVHFRDPGATHKEDFACGTKGAILGGVTAVFDMPNTKPNTSTVERFIEKRDDVAKKAYCDFALYAGATNENAHELAEMEKIDGCCGIKIFMGSSTGDLLVSEDEFLAKVLASGHKMVSIHCEDEEILNDRKQIAQDKAHPSAHPEWRNEESALRATQRIVNLARKAGRKIHTLHITTAEELEFLKNNKDVATVEVLPQHMYFHAPDCYQKLGSLAQMNPPIRGIEHQKAIKKALQEGIVDVVASDHAPHTLEEKARPYPESPSGMPGVQTIVPVMLNFVNQGLLSLEKLACLMSINPAKIFKIKGKGGIYLGQDADFTVVDLNKVHTVTNAEMVNRSGWTPYAGESLKGWPVATILRGQVVMEQGEVKKQMGQILHFDD